MPRTDHQNAVKKTPFSGPPLLLRLPPTDGPTYRILEPADAVYGLAAWTFHKQDRLSREDRRGLFTALIAAWPTVQGPPGRTRHRAFLAMTAKWRGQSYPQIAETLGVKVDTARRLVQRAERELFAGDDLDERTGRLLPTMRIEVAETDADPPDDPSSLATLSRT